MDIQMVLWRHWLMSQLIKSEDRLILLFWVCLHTYCYDHVYSSGCNDLS